MATNTSERVYLLGEQPREWSRCRLSVAQLRKRSDIQAAIAEAPAHSVWIATKADAADELLREAWGSRGRRPSRLGRLLMLVPPRPDSVPALEELFSPVAWGTSSLRLLPNEELAEALVAENRHELFIAGFVDPATDTLLLYRGDFERLAVPLAFLQTAGEGAAPDPGQLSFTDYGQTVRLGAYEAASDAILYEADPDYRRRLNAKRRAEDQSFGACLRRLRILKGLRQRDFASIPAKTIARIERGEVGKPRRGTLQKIARRLGVAADQIDTY